MHRLFCVCHCCGSFDLSPSHCLKDVGVGSTNLPGCCMLTVAIYPLKTHMEYVVGVQAPLLLMKATSVAVRRGVCIHPYFVVKATSMAIRCGCAFTHTLL